MIILIPLFCTLLLLLLKLQVLPIPIIAILSIISILAALSLIGYYSIIAYKHPLQKRISKILSDYEKKHEICQRYQIILNLSGHPITMHTPQEGFNVRFQGCTINGFISTGIFYLVVAHPTHHLSSIANLWSEIGKCHTKFHDMCLAIHPDQVDTLNETLSQEWLFIQQLLHTAPSVSLLINDEQLSQSIYYVKEYGTLPKPITITPYGNLITVLQQANDQLNQWIRQLYIQRHDLCIYPPINDKQKTHLFQLSHSFEKQKTNLLNIIAFSTEAKIPLHSICFGRNEFILPKQNILHKYKQPSVAVLLTALTFGVYGSFVVIKSQVNTTLSLNHGSVLAQQLYTLSRYPQYKHIQAKHLRRLKSSYLDNNPNQATYQYLFSTHKKSDPLLKHDIVNHLTEGNLNKQLVEFLSRHWFKKGRTSKPILSELAPIISEYHIPEVCKILEPTQINNCIQSLSRIKTYQIHDQALKNLEQTLIPLDINNYEHTLRQLNYLIQNPKHIGQGALRQLEDIISKLSLEGHTTLVNKAKDIQSIIYLLQSSNGQYILHKIKDLHVLNHETDSDEDALSLLQKAYMTDRHPLRELEYIQNNLAKYQAKWLKDMTDPMIHNIAQKANGFLKEIWNGHIYPELNNHPISNTDISPNEMHYTFSLIQTYFDRYIRMFVQEEEGDIVVKPYKLGIHIPENILTSYIYTKVVASGLDIKEDHFHAVWAVSLKEMPHPIESIYLHGANKKQPLTLHKGTVLHWDSRYPVGFDVVLQNGETISIIQNNNWSVLQLFSQFNESKPLCYQYKSENQSWGFSIEVKPQYPINLLNVDLIQNIPFSAWQ